MSGYKQLVDWSHLGEDLQRLKTFKEVARVYGCRPAHVARQAHRQKLSWAFLYEDREWLYQKYMVEGLTQKEIAELCGVGRRIISQHMAGNGFETRNPAKVTKVLIVCLNCGMQIPAKRHLQGRKKYCSRTCRINYRLRTDPNVQSFKHSGNGKRPTVAESMLRPMLSYYVPEYLVVEHRPGKKARLWRLDFARPDVMLGIEVDGSVHRRPDIAARDQEKDEFLGRLGWTVLRFTNADVLYRIDEVMARIAAKEVELHARSVQGSSAD